MKPQSAKAKGKWKGCYRQAKTPEEYLEQRYEINTTTGCWVWNKSKDKDGYGQCQDAVVAKQLNVTRAHQLSWKNYYGNYSIGLCVLHKCDNPSCVNPEHLFLGTKADNVKDMINKGRYKHPSTVNALGKLTKEQRHRIKALKNSGRTSLDVAKEFGVSFSRICQLWREYETSLSKK